MVKSCKKQFVVPVMGQTVADVVSAAKLRFAPWWGESFYFTSIVRGIMQTSKISKIQSILLALIMGASVFLAGQVWAAEKPQYGGTITQVHHRQVDSVNFNFVTNNWGAGTFTSPGSETLLIGDIDIYGPRGNGEYPFTDIEFIPYKYLTGALAERWEIKADPMSLTYHLRRGVMFNGNAHIGMAPREFVADDVVYTFKKLIEVPNWAPLVWINLFWNRRGIYQSIGRFGLWLFGS